jgi:hypothetical protein
MRTLDKIATAIVLLMGTGHVAMTPVFAPGLNEAMLWFSGAGLALLFVGILNLCRLSAPADARRGFLLCRVANIIVLAWMALVVAILPVHQAFIVAGAVLVMTILSLRPMHPVPRATQA